MMLDPSRNNRFRLHIAIAPALLALLASCGKQADPPESNAVHGKPTRAGRQSPAPTASTPRSSARSDEQPGSAERDCFLSVDGNMAVDGPCLVFPMGDDGSYTLNTWTRGKPARSHFAVVSAQPDGTAQASWNADPDDDRALDPLGVVHRDRDCWVNDRIRICARPVKVG